MGAVIDPVADRLTDDELVAALAPMSLRSTLDAPSVAAAAGRGLRDADDVAALVAHYEQGLFDSPFAAPVAGSAPAGRRTEVAASVAFQAVVAQFATPVLLAHRVLGVGIRAPLAEVRWRAVGWGTRFGLAVLPRAEPQDLVDLIPLLRADLVEPWLEVIGLHRLVPDRVLVGNADAALWTAVRSVEARAPLTDGERQAVVAAGLGPTRDTCCLIHHAGLVPCDECPRSTGTTDGVTAI